RSAADDELDANRSTRVAMWQQRLTPGIARVATQALAHARRLFATAPQFDLVVAMRLYIAPFVAAFPDARLTILDLDDDEVVTQQRLAELSATLSGREVSDQEKTEVDLWRVLEAMWLPRFDHILVCSEGDRTVVSTRTGH